MISRRGQAADQAETQGAAEYEKINIKPPNHTLTNLYLTVSINDDLGRSFVWNMWKKYSIPGR